MYRLALRSLNLSCALLWRTFCSSSMYRHIVRLTTFVLILFAIILIIFIYLVYVLHLLPVMEPNFIYRSLRCVFSTFIVSNVIFNYLACVLTSPGRPKNCDDPSSILGTTVVTLTDGKKVRALKMQKTVEKNVFYRFCRKCNVIKPPRAHHCSVRGECVLFMDHFCPWMGNTIGYRNYRYFVLCIMFVFVGCIYGVGVLIEPYLTIGVTSSHLKSLDLPGVSGPATIVALFTIMLAALISVGILSLWHFFLSMTNQTTIEFYINCKDRLKAWRAGRTYKSPFDRGWRKNLRRVFGCRTVSQSDSIAVRHIPMIGDSENQSRPSYIASASLCGREVSCSRLIVSVISAILLILPSIREPEEPEYPEDLSEYLANEEARQIENGNLDGVSVIV